MKKHKLINNQLEVDGKYYITPEQLFEKRKDVKSISTIYNWMRLGKVDVKIYLGRKMIEVNNLIIQNI